MLIYIVYNYTNDDRRHVDKKTIRLSGVLYQRKNSLIACSFWTYTVILLL